MVVVCLESTDPFAYEQGLGLALTVADVAADCTDDAAGRAPLGAVVLIRALPEGAESARTLKRLKQLELFEVTCFGPPEVAAVLPFVTVLAGDAWQDKFAALAALPATFLSY